MIREITSLQHPLIKHLVLLRQNRDYREDNQSVAIEGRKLVREICPHLHTKLIMTCDPTWVPENVKAEEILLVNEAIMSKVSGLQAPEGIIAEVAMPPASTFEKKKWIVAFDGISDPGNIGTLIRTSLALGWEGAFVLENSCDPFNDKALRAAKGATFRLPLASGSWSDLKQMIEKKHLLAIAADMHGSDISTFGLTANNQGILLVLSNEAHGVSPEAVAICKRVCIPMPGEMESLNVAVAGGILMYVLKQGKLCLSVG